jgi:hypothetical protein
MITILVCLFMVTAKPKAIPLDEIWAYQMPDTRDVTELQPKIPDPGKLSKEELFRKSPILQIQRSLNERPKEGEKAGPAFVVVGTGEEALKNAHSVFVKKDEKEPVRFFPSDTDLSLVFYSYMSGRYVHIKSVEQSDKLITVKYQFVSHQTQEVTHHFALIPLGKLSPGTVQVKIKELPPVNEQNEEVERIPSPKSIVCDSFSFRVKE